MLKGNVLWRDILCSDSIDLQLLLNNFLLPQYLLSQTDFPCIVDAYGM